MALVTLRMRDTPLTQEFYFRNTLRPASTPPPHDSAEPAAPKQGAELPWGGREETWLRAKPLTTELKTQLGPRWDN